MSKVIKVIARAACFHNSKVMQPGEVFDMDLTPYGGEFNQAKHKNLVQYTPEAKVAVDKEIETGIKATAVAGQDAAKKASGVKKDFVG